MRRALLTSNLLLTEPVNIGYSTPSIEASSWPSAISLVNNSYLTVDSGNPATEDAVITSVRLKAAAATNKNYIVVGKIVSSTSFVIREISHPYSGLGFSTIVGVQTVAVNMMIRKGECIGWINTGSGITVLSGPASGNYVHFALSDINYGNRSAGTSRSMTGATTGNNMYATIYATGTKPAPVPSFPLTLDDCETGVFDDKWNTFGTTKSSYQTTSPISGTKSINLDGGGADGLSYYTWFIKKEGYIHKRGDIISLICSASKNAANAFTLHIHSRTGDNQPHVLEGFALDVAGDSMRFSYVSQGDKTNLGSGTISPASLTYRLRVYVNPQNHPTNPGAWSAVALNPTTNEVLASISGTTTFPYDYSGICLQHDEIGKGGGASFKVDDIKVEGRNG